MKKFVLSGIVLFLIMFVNCSLVFSEYIAFVGTGYSSYCYNAIPGGTFQLQLVGSNCANTYDWSCNSGSGWNSISSTCTGTSVTYSQTYPSITTTYRCVENGVQTWYFLIKVYNPTSYNVGGGSCCDYYADITLSGSGNFYNNYYLYKNGVYTGNHTMGSGSALNFPAQPWPGTYTIKVIDSAGCEKWMSGSASITHYCCKGKTEVEEENTNSLVKVFPNPGGEVIFIETSSKGEYYLYNEIGQIVKQINFTSDNEVIEVIGLLPGIYILKCRNGNAEISTRISIVE
jgi:hypothetical protein